MTKKKTEPYFGKTVENAINEYCNLPECSDKQKLFNNIIYPALSKLAENVIFNKNLTNFGGDSYTDVKQDCVCFLYEKLGKYNPNNGSKAFSYFNKVCINWVWAKMRDVAENTYGKCDVEHIDYSRDVDLEVFQQDIQEQIQDFCQKWHTWGMEYMDYFYFIRNSKPANFNSDEKKVLEAILNLFKNSHSIDIYKKKALYILIREQVNVETQIITNVINVLRPLCKSMFIEFKQTGTTYWHRHLYYPEHIQGEIPLPDDIHLDMIVSDLQNERYKITKININEILLTSIADESFVLRFPKDFDAISVYDFWDFFTEEIINVKEE